MDNRALSVRKFNLCKHLRNAEVGSPDCSPARLPHLEKVPRGECYIDLQPSEVKVLDLERLGADEWTVDPE